jgi:hypothetical protein
VIIPSRSRAFLLALFALAAIGGTAAAFYYAHAALTLSHYDARAHLVVARRIFDNLTPGWKQIGAVWLPLPHLLNAIPVQIDAFYRTGASAVAMSVVAFAITVVSIVWIVTTLTGSRAAGVVGAAAFALNPNVLYLQSTPMTEPLLLAFLLAGVATVVAWSRTGSPSPLLVGMLFMLACLTRYEAWPVTAAALAGAVWTRYRAGAGIERAMADGARIAVLPALGVLAFLALSKALMGEWFIASGFFVPDNPARGQPLAVAWSIVLGVTGLSGRLLMVTAAAGLVTLLVAAVDRSRAAWLIPTALVATAMLPFGAFLSGHPFRVRYMVPLLAVQAIAVGTCAGYWRRTRVVTLTIATLAIALELRPLSATAPMVVEAQWDRPNAAGRRTVTDCLARGYDGSRVLASMNSLGHYMQELAAVGFDVRDFVFEGNFVAWNQGLEHPEQVAGWILISEGTDGRDALLAPARNRPAFLGQFTRVCEGGNVALYRRDATPAPLAESQKRTANVSR